MKKDFNRNPAGKNQWQLRSNEEIQKIINKYPDHWTKKDFRGEGKNNSKKILSKTETEREGLIFKYSGKAKQTLKKVYKYSTQESIDQFENNLISEEIFRDMALLKVISNEKKRSKAKKLCKKFDSVILDKSKKSIVIQVTALRREIDKLVSDLKPLGLASVSRTGAVAMTRGSEIFK